MATEDYSRVLLLNKEFSYIDAIESAYTKGAGLCKGGQ